MISSLASVAYLLFKWRRNKPVFKLCKTVQMVEVQLSYFKNDGWDILVHLINLF